MKLCLKIALIPAYNPEPCLINLVQKLKGKGCALKTDLTYIQKYVSENYTVVTVDADGQHRSKDVEMVCKMVPKHPGCLVAGPQENTKGNSFKKQAGKSDYPYGLYVYHRYPYL